MTSPSEPQLTQSWRLVQQTFGEYKRYAKSIWLLVAIVTVPLKLAGLVSAFNGSPQFPTYSLIISTFMNVALIYLIMHVRDHRKAPLVRDAYFDGTARILSFLLVSLVLILTLIPAAFGLILYLIGTSSDTGTAVSIGEALIVGFVALLIAIPTVWLLARFIFALYAVMGDGLRPLTALRHSRALTIDHFWAVVRRLLVLGLVLLILAIMCVLPSFLIGLVVHSTPLLDGIFLMLTNFIILPIASLYLSKVYRELGTI